MFALKDVNEDTAMKRMGVEDFKGKENREWREREGKAKEEKLMTKV